MNGRSLSLAAAAASLAQSVNDHSRHLVTFNYFVIFKAQRATFFVSDQST